ncbi:MAG TPA: SCO family protein [Bacteroidales bacterium]|nr:SCO family protein [Lentimicrobiaceae bacterium]HOH99724.1 SCO family protein [Bacteroidales bacterium]
MQRILLTTLLLLFTGVFMSAQSPYYDKSEPEIGVVEKLGEFLPDDLMVINDTGGIENLLQIINKPTIINFVYYRCPGVCTPVMNGLAEVIERSEMVLGKDYQVLTISFDPTESPEMAKKKHSNYMSQISREVDPMGWRFFTADSLNAARGTDAVGFKYKRTGNDYLHSATIIMVSPEGKITRYLHGTSYLPFELKMSVVEAMKGQPGPTINRILEYCYAYDPAGQQYVLNVTKVSGTIIVFIALVIFLFLILKPRRKESVTKEQS